MFVSGLGFFVLTTLVSLEGGNAFPQPSLVNCQLEAVIGVAGANPIPGNLRDRDTIMGTQVTNTPKPFIAEFERQNDDWYILTISDDGYDLGDGFIVHSADSELDIMDGASAGATLAERDDCEGRNWIAYDLKPGDRVRWNPWNDDSIVAVWFGQGLSQPVGFMEFNSDGHIDPGGSDDEPVTFADTFFRIVISALTLLYLNFLWVNIEPLKMLGFKGH